MHGPLAYARACFTFKAAEAGQNQDPGLSIPKCKTNGHNLIAKYERGIFRAEDRSHRLQTAIGGIPWLQGFQADPPTR